MRNSNFFHAVVMITGTTIGTGILGLPITTSQAGFLPSSLAFVVSWFFMTLAALYILEVKMYFQQHYTLSSLIQFTLGRLGHTLAFFISLILLYALLCTYIMTGASWLKLLLGNYFFLKFYWVAIIFVVVFGTLLTLKERFIYQVNQLLVIALVLSFMIMVGMSIWPINLDLIRYSNPIHVIHSMPLLLTTFGYSVIVPTLTEYLEYDAVKARSAIILGSLIALIAYFIWEWVTLGHIPKSGPNGFDMLYRYGDNGTGVISFFTANPWAMLAGKLFAIFADITSFFGVTLALMHCLSDWLYTKRAHGYNQKRGRLMLLALIPPLLVTLVYPKAFIEILSFAGLSVALLLGLFPALMRIQLSKLTAEYSHPSCSQHLQSILRLMTAVFFTAVIIIELYNLIHG